MARSRTKAADLPRLADGKYLAKCRDANALSAAFNGHSQIWPEAEMVIKKEVATFYKDGVPVWNCNMHYAAHNFDVTPA